MAAQAQFPAEQSESGEFRRQEDAFRDTISADGSTPFPAVAGRYQLYVSLACPWAHRTIIVRHLKGLQDVIGVSIVDPIRDERGWAFSGTTEQGRDPAEGFRFLSEAYAATDPRFEGRVTVPVLWDKQTRRIVNNSEDDICRMFNDAFVQFTAGTVDLFPADIADEHGELSLFIYENLNNGVYQAGFATMQEAYERSCRAVFDALDRLEKRLAARRYLFGSRIVEADWRLFCTLVRFDAVYHGHFKCNMRRIADYPRLSAYLRDLYNQPGIAETVNFDHIKRHYYVTHTEINPTQIVPLGPVLDFVQLQERAVA